MPLMKSIRLPAKPAMARSMRIPPLTAMNEPSSPPAAAPAAVMKPAPRIMSRKTRQPRAPKMMFRTPIVVIPPVRCIPMTIPFMSDQCMSDIGPIRARHLSQLAQMPRFPQSNRPATERRHLRGVKYKSMILRSL